jgi:prepilin signal peptidase PulO-like enzyme (type II secretory pathway)
MQILALASEPFLPAVFAWVVAFAFGLNVGSFLNVVAHRLPMGLSVVRPRSRCPACRAPIGARDNLPVVSWLLLRGRCRGCKGRISGRYPAVELVAGGLAVVVVHLLVVAPDAVSDPWAWLHAGAVFLVTAALFAASLIDLDHTILPDEITLGWMWPAPVVAAVLPQMTLGPSLLAPWWLPEALQGLPTRAIAAIASLAGIAVGGGLVWLVRAVGSALVGKEAMGFGDVKWGSSA